MHELSVAIVVCIILSAVSLSNMFVILIVPLYLCWFFLVSSVRLIHVASPGF